MWTVVLVYKICLQDINKHQTIILTVLKIQQFGEFMPRLGNELFYIPTECSFKLIEYIKKKKKIEVGKAV